MKRFLSITLCVMLIASLFAVNVSAAVLTPQYTEVDETTAKPEVVYLNQDFSDAKTDFTTKSYAGNFSVTDGVLTVTPSTVGSRDMDTTSSAAITNGKYTFEFDFCRKGTLDTDFRVFVTFQRAANKEKTNGLQRYGVHIPVGVNNLTKDTWYTYRLNVDEAAYTSSNNDVTKLMTIEYKQKSGDTWTALGYADTWDFSANGGYAARVITGTNALDWKKSACEMVLGVTDAKDDLGQTKFDAATMDARNAQFSFDNIKVYTPAVSGEVVEKTYPIVGGVNNFVQKDEIVTKKYANDNANSAQLTYTTSVGTAPTADNGVVNRFAVTFDAINTVKGMPVTIHTGGAGSAYGFDILSTDTIFNKWYTYKAVCKEYWGTRGGKEQVFVDVVGVYRKPCDGNGNWELCGSDAVNIAGALSGSSNEFRVLWNKTRENLAYPGTDLGKTEWKFRNIQVVTGSYIVGSASAENGKVTLNAEFTGSAFPSTAIMAVYAGNKLVDIAYVKHDAGVGAADLTADYTEGNKVMLYIWDAIDSGIPLLSAALDITDKL